MNPFDQSASLMIADDTPAPEAPSHGSYGLPTGPRIGGARVSLHNGQATVETFNRRSLPGGPEGHIEQASGPVAPTAGPVAQPAARPVRLMSATGSPVLARNADLASTMVDLPGVGTTSLAAALHAGIVQETPGGFEFASDVAPAGEHADGPAEQQQDQQPDLLPDTYETLVGEIIDAAGDGIVGRALAELENGGIRLDGDLVRQIATSKGCSSEHAMEAVQHAYEGFQAQAREALTNAVGDADQVIEWASSDRKGRDLLNQAIRAQVQNRSLSGYETLARAFLADMAHRDPQALLGAQTIGGGQLKMIGNELVIVDPETGRAVTSLSAGLRMGAVPVSVRKRR